MLHGYWFVMEVANKLHIFPSCGYFNLDWTQPSHSVAIPLGRFADLKDVLLSIHGNDFFLPCAGISVAHRLP